MVALLVDAGNTSLKWAYLENDELSAQEFCFYNKQSAITIFNDLLNDKQKRFKKVLMVSVLGEQFNSEAKEVAESYSVIFERVKSTAELAYVKNGYQEPEKLGADRFVGMIAAYHLINSKKTNQYPCIIIDTGTATTIDAIDSNGNHLGGLILPGIDLCRNSLLDNTKQLSLWSQQQLQIKPTLFATETTSAIVNATIFGLAGAIDSICGKMEKDIQNQSKGTIVKKVICGGNAKIILPYMQSEYLFQENLIMLGLSFILRNKEGY